MHETPKKKGQQEITDVGATPAWETPTVPRSLGDSYIAPELNTLASLLSQLRVDLKE